MRQKIVFSFLYGSISGVMLDLMQSVIYYLIYPCFQDRVGLALNTSIAVGTLIIIAGIYRKNRSFLHALLRLVVQMVACVITFFLSGGIGSWFLSLNHQTLSENNGNVVGLMLGISTMAIFGLAIIIVLVREVICGIYKVWKKYRK